MHYKKKRIIGKGTYGTVHLVTDPHGNTFALKQTELASDSLHLDSSAFIEPSLLQALRHPNIITPIEIFMEGRFLNIVLPLVEETLETTKKRTLNQWKKIFFNLLSAGLYMEQHHILHRDIKPANILMNKDVPFIIDFGLGIKKLTEKDHLSTVVQSFYWRAPEIFYNIPHYDSRIDVWSFGVILVEMLIGEDLFPGKSEKETLQKMYSLLNPSQKDISTLTKKVPLKRISPGWEGVPKWKPEYKGIGDFLVKKGIKDTEFISLIKNMLEWNPDKRFHFHDCVSHPWFQGMQPIPGQPLNLVSPRGNDLEVRVPVLLKMGAFLSRVMKHFQLKFNESTYLLSMALFQNFTLESFSQTYFRRKQLEMLASFTIATSLNEPFFLSLDMVVEIGNEINPHLKFKVIDLVKAVEEKFKSLGFQGYFNDNWWNSRDVLKEISFGIKVGPNPYEEVIRRNLGL